MTPQQLNGYLTGARLPGNEMHSRLRSLGCDIEWLMTGQIPGGEQHSRGHPSDVALLGALKELGIHSPDELRRLVDENDKLRRALGPEVIAALSEAAIVMEKQAKYKIRKRKR